MSVSELMQQDTESRESIVLNTSTNFFVEAGAGSGKTTMLVRRMVAMVEAGIDVSRICAITFTKAASGEFYERFQKMLALRSTAPTQENFVRQAGELMNPTDESRRKCLEALRNIDLCFMGTIDSFCNMVLSEHPAEAGIPSGAAVMEDSGMKAVYIREYSRMLKGDYGADIQQECSIFDRINGQSARDAFVTGLNTIMDIRHTDICVPQCADSLDEEVKEERDELRFILGLLASTPEAAYTGKNKENTKAWEELNDNLETIEGIWEDDIVGVTYAVKGIVPLRLSADWWSKYSSRLGMYEDFFAPHESKGKIVWYEVDSARTDSIISKVEGYKSSRCLSFLCHAAKMIADTCKTSGELTFFDYLLYLRDMLKKDAEGTGKLIRHIYDRHSYFLIDEFQDTNPMQAEIFFYLTAENPVADWRRCVPRPGSLFIVGDPKQSIYRFRNADVASFLKVKALFTGDVGRVLYLTRNFRSTYGLREWFNSTFSAMLAEETEEQSRFDEIPLEDRPADDGTFGGVYSYEACTDKGATEEMKDPAVVTRIIEQLVGNPDYLLPGGKGKNASKGMVSYNDFMLITPNKKILAAYMKSFVKAGIPFYVEGETLFKDCPALAEIVKLFEVMAKPNDLHILYKALTGKILGFHRNRIAKCGEKLLTAEDGTQCRFRIDVFADNSMFTVENGHADAEKLKNTLNTLGRLAREAYSMSSSALFYTLMNRFRVFEKAGADNLEYVWFALELLRAKELDGTVASLLDGAAFLNELISSKSGLERCISLKTENDRVHMANLHKVKGLEAPIVFLAWPTGGDHEPQRRTEQCEPIPKSWIFKLEKPNEPGVYRKDCYFKTDAFENEMQREVVSGAAEKLRLLYVAATRAKNVLLVSNKIKSDGTPADGNPWQAFVDVAQEDFFNLPAGHYGTKKKRPSEEISVLYDGHEDTERFGGDAVKKSYGIKRPSKIKVKGRSEPEDESSENLTESEQEQAPMTKGKGRADGNIIGTMVHRVMEVLVSSGNMADAEKLACETVAEYGYEYPEKEEEYRKVLISVIRTVRGGGYAQESEVSADIIAELLSADEVYCEVPFCHREEKEDGRFIIWNGVIDVLYRKGDDWHIIDYKTNAESEGLDEKYEEQLNAYIKAVKVITGNDADAGIYHIGV